VASATPWSWSAEARRATVLSAPPSTRSAAAPLAGVTVVDLTRHLPGPLTAHLLADLGAGVVKVEEPAEGDPVRLAPPLRRGRGALAALLLSGSRSVALDLKSQAGRRVLERLLEEADVLIESFRPGTLARLGFDPEALRRRHSRLIVCSISGWGQDGPYSARAGHDLTYQALAGTLASTAPAMPPFPAADATGAWAAVSSILAALYAREQTGTGTWIDAALFDAAVHNGLVAWAEEVGGSRASAPASVGAPHGLSGALPCYRLYRTADGGQLAVAALETHFWRRLCRAAGRDDLVRVQYREGPEARSHVAEMVASRTLADWREILADLDLPVEPVLAPGETARLPQAARRDMLRTADDGLYRLGFPARFEGDRPRAGSDYPELGQDTDALLAAMEEDGPVVPGVPRGGRARRRAGVGRRFSLRRWIRRWLATAR